MHNIKHNEVQGKYVRPLLDLIRFPCILYICRRDIW